MSPPLKLFRLRLQRTWRRILLIACAATALVVTCELVGPLNELLQIDDGERGAYDQGLKAFTNKRWFPWGKVHRSKDIVVVAIDDHSFQRIPQTITREYGRWPYYRLIWARALEHFTRQGARAVVFDATMDEPEPASDGDALLAQAAQESVPFYLGFNLLPGTPELPKVTPTNRLGPVRLEAPPEAPEEEPADPGEDAPPQFEDVPEEAATATPEQVADALAFPVETGGGLTVSKVPSMPTFNARGEAGPELDQHPMAPITPLLDVLAGFGAVLTEVDTDDGKMRRTRFAYQDGENTYVTLAVAVAADLLGARSVRLEPGKLVLGDRTLAINHDGSAEIHYGGQLEERFPVIPLWRVVRDIHLELDGRPTELPADTFRGKVVMIGGFALGTADLKPTPFQALSPGIAKHAAELESLLSGRFITYAPYWASVALALAVALFSVLIITVLKSTLLEIAWPLLLFFGFFAVTGTFLAATQIHVLSAMPMLAGEFASVAAVAFNHLFAERDREQLRNMFQSYMERDLLEQMLESRELPKLDGENLEVTAFFSDIRGFSTFSEEYRDTPRAVMHVLNMYLSRVTKVLVQNGACIDKYIGDAVVCLFGAPVKNPQHALMACRAALAVQAEVAKLREEFIAKGLPDVYTRIGLNTDEMLVGNIGSDQLLDYTAIGDGMNLASRLEGANKAYDTLIVIGPGTYDKVRDQVEARELDWVRVAGKGERVPIYELLALKGQLPPERRSVVEHYAAALAKYREARFDGALTSLEAALAIDPNDGPSRTLAARCRALLQEPPEAFDGVAQLEK